MRPRIARVVVIRPVRRPPPDAAPLFHGKAGCRAGEVMVQLHMPIAAVLAVTGDNLSGFAPFGIGWQRRVDVCQTGRDKRPDFSPVSGGHPWAMNPHELDFRTIAEQGLYHAVVRIFFRRRPTIRRIDAAAGEALPAPVPPERRKSRAACP